MDINKIRKDFPILSRKINKKKLVYLDTAATSQRPACVINAISDFYKKHNANVQRGLYKLSEESTQMYEDARGDVAKFINASPEEIVFVRNTTEAINLVAHSLDFKKGDEVISTIMEHHSNIVPWQMLDGVKLNFVDIDGDYRLKTSDYNRFVNKNTKLATLTHQSNVLGTINNVKEIAKIAHESGALVLVDGAQSVPHMSVNVKKLDCDFLAFSGHKMLGPTGIGILYGKKDILESMKPFLGGGDMIREVRLEKTTYNAVPHKFEAGTPSIADAIGLKAAVDYLKKIGMKNIREHEKKLTRYAMKMFSGFDDITIYGPEDINAKGGVVSFSLEGAHPHDIATILDSEGIAIRSGHACAQPLMRRLGIPAVARTSFYLYNTEEEVDRLADGLNKVRKVLKL